MPAFTIQKNRRWRGGTLGLQRLNCASFLSRKIAMNVQDPLLFELPDAEKPAVSPQNAASGAKKAKRSGKAPATLPESLQPYLPGLSRRGRPRVKNPLPASARAIASRKRRLEAGMKRIELLLAPDTAAALERLRRYPRLSIGTRADWVAEGERICVRATSQ
jgi:hypothetical protein